MIIIVLLLAIIVAIAVLVPLFILKDDDGKSLHTTIRLKPCSHVTKLCRYFSLKFLPIFSPKLFCQGIEWLTYPLTLIFYSLIQNNFGENFGLNFVMCEQSLTAAIISGRSLFERTHCLFLLYSS